MLNLYKILDINPTASQSEIFSASEKLIAEWDPSKIEDRKNRAIVAGVLREIREARDVLSDHRKRREYDVSIGLAKIVYKENFKSKQNIENDQSGSADYKTRVNIPNPYPEETDSEAEEFYDSNSGLTSDNEKAALNDNRKEATNSDPFVEAYKIDNVGNTAESQEKKAQESSKDTIETSIKSFEKAGVSSSKRDDMVVENQQQSTENNKKKFTESESLFLKNSNFLSNQEKNSKAVPSNEHTELDATKNVKSANNSKASENNTIPDFVSAAKSVLSNVKEGISSKLSHVDTYTDNITSSATDFKKKKESKSLEDNLKKDSEPKVADRENDQDDISESTLNSNDNVLSNSKDESNKSLSNQSSESTNFTKKTKSGNNSEEKNVLDIKNLANSKSKDDGGAAKIPSVLSTKSVKHKLIDNNVSKSKNNHLKDMATSSPPNVDITTEDQHLLPLNQKPFNVGDKIINTTTKPTNTSEEKIGNDKSSGAILSSADAVSKVDDEDKSSVHLNEDTKQTNMSNPTLNSDENYEATENQVGILNKNSENSKDSIIINSSIFQNSTKNIEENTSNSDNGVETEKHSISSKNRSNGELSKISSRILRNSEEKDVSNKAQNSFKSGVTRKEDSEGIPALNGNLKRASEPKSADSIHQYKDSHSKLKLHTTNIAVNNEQQTADASSSENSNLIQGKEFKSNLFNAHQGPSNSEIFSSETVWKRDEPPNLSKVNSSAKKPHTSQHRFHTKSVSASTISRGSETKTVYFYGPEGERVEVYVDGKLRVQVTKGESEDSYTSDWHNSESPTTAKRLCASTTIDANDIKIKTMRVCDGKQETISVHKDHVLMCKISNKIN